MARAKGGSSPVTAFVEQFTPSDGDFGAAIQQFLALKPELKPVHFLPLSGSTMLVAFADKDDELIKNSYQFASPTIPSAASAPSERNSVVIALRNNSGSTIVKGRLVAVAGFDAIAGRPTVRLADKDDPPGRPAVGVTTADVANGANFDALVVGTLTGVDTSAFALTDQLVLGDLGVFARPPLDVGGITTGEVQYVGSVSRVSATDGEIIVSVVQAMDVVTVDEEGALQGTNGTPSATNRYVTDSDPRLDPSSPSSASLKVLQFAFTHTSGSASTGTLSFTPKAALYIGTVVNANGTHLLTGFATGTGTLAKSAGFGVTVQVSSAVHRINSDNDSIAGGLSTTFGGTSHSEDLDVTMFGMTGIELSWSSGVTTHNGFLLVLG